MRTKYVQIERSAEYKQAYTTLKAAQHMIETGAAESCKPVTLSQIKALRLFEYREDHYFRDIAEREFVAKYDGKRFKAKVIDGGSKCEMLVTILGAEELHLQRIYACNIAGKKTWYPETACVYYETGQIVDVELKVFSNFQLFVNGLTQGILDEKQWDRIKDKSLAFRCDESGNAVTGLFK